MYTCVVVILIPYLLPSNVSEGRPNFQERAIASLVKGFSYTTDLGPSQGAK